MADDKDKVDFRDRDRVNVNEDYELRYWCERFNVEPDVLKQTVERVGVMVEDVERALRSR